MEDLNKKVTLYCDRCGNDQFYFEDTNNSDVELVSDDTILKCSDCGKIFTKEELIELNAEVITANVEDMKEEIVKEVQREINKLFKDWR
ncbi:ECs_2282 family putative zinc-binding protein [Catenibacterium mitsuokai]|uniref:ECs_2282 family putative zinc-binding protein n=1 Tax=Catenibacterium mitsuokai TaxID=100886 RepID=UPI002E77176D|nr:hypothetical protein [Catenibacterium tridentinum]